jgi:hypothetical protein
MRENQKRADSGDSAASAKSGVPAARVAMTRVAMALASIGLVAAAAHPLVSCAASRTIGDAAGALLLLAAGFVVATPRETKHRFRPLALAALAIVAHGLLAH